MDSIASWSGGKDSTATIILAHIHNEPLDEIVMSEVMFDLERNISGELPEQIEWVYNIAKPTFESWGYKVTILRSDRDYIKEFFNVIKRSSHPERIGKYSAWAIGGLCAINRSCKMKPIKQYFKRPCIQYVGIAIDEPVRLERLHKHENRISLLEKYGYTEQMAYDLCEKYNLLSPIYEKVSRGGCWFCPNSTIREFSSIKQNHPQLWNELYKLSLSDNMVSQGFKYGKTFAQVDREVDAYIEYQKLETNQLSMF